MTVRANRWLEPWEAAERAARIRRLTLAGESAEQIARRLDVSSRTVRRYRARNRNQQRQCASARKRPPQGGGHPRG